MSGTCVPCTYTTGKPSVNEPQLAQSSIALTQNLGARSVSEIRMYRQLRRRPLRIEPFQQKRDADADEDEGPDASRADMDCAQVREQKRGATDQKYRGSDTTMKGTVLNPVGEAAYGHSKKTRSRG